MIRQPAPPAQLERLAPAPRRRVRTAASPSFPTSWRGGRNLPRVERASRLLRESVEPWHQSVAISVQHGSHARALRCIPWWVPHHTGSVAWIVYDGCAAQRRPFPHRGLIKVTGRASQRAAGTPCHPQRRVHCHHRPLGSIPLMGGDVCRAGRLEDTRGRGDLVGRAVRHHEELVRLEGRLVLHNTILGDANTIQRGAQRTQPAPPQPLPAPQRARPPAGRRR